MAVLPSAFCLLPSAFCLIALAYVLEAGVIRFMPQALAFYLKHWLFN
jgi:hypothetical protein